MISYISAPTESDLLVTPVRQLYLHLMSFPTATAALTAWLSAYGSGFDPVRADVVGDVHRYTRVGRDGTLAQRRVRLISGRHVLSTATIVYRAYALPEDLRTQLQTTDLPFGEVIASCGPSRRTTYARARVALPGHSASDVACEFMPVLDIHATVSALQHGPIARVHETYGACLLTMLTSHLDAAHDHQLPPFQNRVLART